MPTYWRFPASRQIDHILTSDINNDGVNEILVTSENGRVDLLGADGTLQWSYSANETIQTLNTVNIDSDDNPELEVVLVIQNKLILLDSTGEVLWHKMLSTIDVPPSLFTYDDQEVESFWQTYYVALASQVVPFDQEGDGRDEILILFDTGQLQIYDQTGERIWQRLEDTTPSVSTQPHVAVGDVNQDGYQEIVLGFFNPRKRFSEITLIGNNGKEIWEQDQPVSGRINAIVLAPILENGELAIAVANDRGQLHLYHHNRQRLWWPRTLNKSITSLAFATFPEGPALVAGTEVGSVVAYAMEGRRYWTRHLAPNADRPVINLSAAAHTSDENEATLAVILGPESGSDAPNDVYMLNHTSRTLTVLEDLDTAGLSRLLDINGDEKSEILLSRFAIIELLGLGVGASETAGEWGYSLDAEPASFLVVDFDRDGIDELLIGAQNGFLHYLQNRNSPRWKVEPGGAITHLALLSTSNLTQNIVMVRHITTANDINEEENDEGWIELRQINGEQIWQQFVPTQITSLLVHNIDDQGNNEIIVGTKTGDIFVYTAEGQLLWEMNIYGFAEPIEPIEKLLAISNLDTNSPQLIAVTPRSLYSIRIDTRLPLPPITSYDNPIENVFPLHQPGRELALSLLTLDMDSIHGLTWRGIQMPQWPIMLGARPTISVAANRGPSNLNTAESFLIATTSGELHHLSIDNNEPTIQWTLTGLGNITGLHWGDLDGDQFPEIAVGDSDGKIQIFTTITRPEPQRVDEIPVSGGVFALAALQRTEDQRADLLAVTVNGEVQLFRAQENRPPLLINPHTEVGEGQYSFSVTAVDVEGDEVRVRLEIKNPDTGEWEAYEEEVLNNGNGLLFWPVVNPPADENGVNYRFSYTDGSYAGTLVPTPGPQPLGLSNLINVNLAALAVVSIVSSAILLFIIRQTQVPAARARRFYQGLRKQPVLSLTLLENQYIRTHGSRDFLLYLASQARQQGDHIVSGLADGLFLLADRAHMGLPIIISALEEAYKFIPRWQSIDRWQMIFKTGYALLEAPSITELSLLRPQLVQLLTVLEEQNQWSPVLDALLPILTNVRDSERVDQVGDQIIYLSEASHRLRELNRHLPEFSIRMEKTLVAAITKRWSGLISAATEELRGRAFLQISLKTRRVVPSERTQITFEVVNNGRAAAENIVATLEENPAYTNYTLPQMILFLPQGHKRQISFHIEPHVPNRFRLALNVTFADRNQRHKEFAFGDMVHLLLPVRNFKPISNPYLPGTPLRHNSPVFFGREQLFSFIADNAGSWSQRNAMILIGQRRTGKTSVLLQLDQHLPDNLLPVYIDCQSLGVTPGMPAFFNDLAWLIADVLSAQHIEVDVPEPSAWEANPTGQFQRHFLPQVQALLPPDTTILLVFDEFEAFENLVNDGILPSTFFSFMRHLMQHSNGFSFLFVGTRRLEEMSADYWSVLFNMALYERVGYLNEEAAIRLISEPVAPNLVYDDLALDKILRVTAGHPYFLQLVCYTLVKRANEQRTGYITITDVNAALEEMLSLGEVHFAYLWQRSTQAERILLTAVAHMTDSDLAFHPEDLTDFLEPYGIQLPPSDVTAALHSLVQRDILHEVTRGGTTLYELNIGLVGLWTAHHKSLSKLHAMQTNGAPHHPTKEVVAK